MPIRKDITRKELLALLYQYDLYIQNANDGGKYESGWMPVCLNEFYDVEWAEIKESEPDAIERYSIAMLEEMERLDKRSKMP
jgi:hypothetical protein